MIFVKVNEVLKKELFRSDDNEDDFSKKIITLVQFYEYNKKSYKNLVCIKYDAIKNCYTIDSDHYGYNPLIERYQFFNPDNGEAGFSSFELIKLDEAKIIDTFGSLTKRVSSVASLKI